MSYTDDQVKNLRDRDIAGMSEEQIVSIITNAKQCAILTDEQVNAINKRLKELKSEWEIKAYDVIFFRFNPRNN